MITCRDGAIWGDGGGRDQVHIKKSASENREKTLPHFQKSAFKDGERSSSSLISPFMSAYCRFRSKDSVFLAIHNDTSSAMGMSKVIGLVLLDFTMLLILCIIHSFYIGLGLLLLH